MIKSRAIPMTAIICASITLIAIFSNTNKTTAHDAPTPAPYTAPMPAPAIALASSTIAPAANAYPPPYANRCAREDAINCYWNAGVGGNHRGISFYAISLPHSSLICRIYPDHHDLDSCATD
jgi:hypothetical protein